jgi:ComF family protein
MSSQNVKNTIVERLLSTVAPHPCLGCGKVGSVLCAHCKYNITSEPFTGCIVCGEASGVGICAKHSWPIERAFVVGERSEVLELVINKLKFNNLKAAAGVLAQLLDESLPVLPGNTVIVPIPTVRSHIRQRGYDQVDLIARHFAALRGLTIQRPLVRVGKATMHKLDKQERKTASEQAFSLEDWVPTTAPVLILDDIITTGATIRRAGALLKPLSPTIWVAALAYQPLD